MGAVAVGAVLFGLFLLIVAAMVWQEARVTDDRHPTYVLEEVVPFVYQRLSDDAAAHIDGDDVMRILEWEVYYLQGLNRNGANAPPVAGSVEALEFILERSQAAGHAYRSDDVAEVLALEVAYLQDIGAIGPVATEGRAS
jgi:hypothetical protein